MKPVRVVCATRASQQDFLQKSALGRSLVAHRQANPVDVLLFPENSQGLPTLYNQAIDQAKDKPAILVFVHDDVHLCDFVWSERIAEAVRVFDVVGLAGNTRRVPHQPAWAFVDDKFTWDQQRNLSGIVGHGTRFPCEITHFGAPRQACKLLDGLLLAADSEVLIESGVRFDEQFKFHFYDMDFCRQTELAGLTMGTWPLSVVHESGGAFGSPGWTEALGRYRNKYAD
jgi:GT2 family glycosyltransferase